MSAPAPWAHRGCSSQSGSVGRLFRTMCVHHLAHASRKCVLTRAQKSCRERFETWHQFTRIDPPMGIHSIVFFTRTHLNTHEPCTQLTRLNLISMTHHVQSPCPDCRPCVCVCVCVCTRWMCVFRSGTWTNSPIAPPCSADTIGFLPVESGHTPYVQTSRTQLSTITLLFQESAHLEMFTFT